MKLLIVAALACSLGVAVLALPGASATVAPSAPSVVAATTQRATTQNGPPQITQASPKCECRNSFNITDTCEDCRAVITNLQVKNGKCTAPPECSTQSGCSFSFDVTFWDDDGNVCGEGSAEGSSGCPGGGGVIVPCPSGGAVSSNYRCNACAEVEEAEVEPR